MRNNPIARGRGAVTGRAAAEGRTIHVVDVENDPEYSYGGRSLERYRSIVAVPMMRDATPVGIVTLWRHHVEAFTPRQIALVETFADQAVVAIENVRLFNETKEALERQTATAEILKVIAASPTDVQPVFEAIAIRANALISGFSATVLRYVGDALHLAAFTPTNPAADEALDKSFPRPLAEFPPVELNSDGRTAAFTDTESEGVPLWNSGTGALRGYRSMLFTPLMSRRPDRIDQRHAQGAGPLRRAPRPAAQKLRRSGGDRDRECAPVRRSAGRPAIFRRRCTADRDCGRLEGHQPFGVRSGHRLRPRRFRGPTVQRAAGRHPPARGRIRRGEGEGRRSGILCSGIPPPRERRDRMAGRGDASGHVVAHRQRSLDREFNGGSRANCGLRCLRACLAAQRQGRRRLRRSGRPEPGPFTAVRSSSCRPSPTRR